MPNQYKVLLLVFSILLIVSYNPVHSYGMESTEKDVIIGYENTIGKQLIFEKSSHVDYEFHHISAVAVSIDQSDLDILKKNSNISYIEKNVPIKLSKDSQNIEEVTQINLAETERWNIESTSGLSAWEEGFTGKEVNIAVIDTGISPHPDLKVSGGFSTVDSIQEWTDDNGHGTHVAGIIGSERNDTGTVGIAPDANLFAVKALDKNGEGTLADLIEGIEWSIQNNMDIINLSLGTDDNSSALQDVINKAYKAGILIVAASGNGGTNNSVNYPAKYENVIGVSAVNEQFNITSFSSTGPEVEFSAPGVNIVSTYLNESYGKAHGTSQASPHVTGILALLKKKKPELNSTELRNELINYVQDLGEPGRDPFYGHGFVNFNPDVKAPGEVTNLQAREISTDAATVSWSNPSEEDFQMTTVYLNNKFIKSINLGEKATYTFKGLDPDTAYTVTVHTEDRFGNLSKGVTQTVKTEAIVRIKEETDRSEEVAVSDTQDKDETSEEQPVKQIEHGGKNPSTKKVNKQPAKKELVVSRPGSTNQSNEERGTGGTATENQYDSVDVPNKGLDEKDVKDKTTEATQTDENNKDISKNIETTSEKEDTQEKETPNKDSEEVNIFVKFFSSLAKIFISITDWIVGLLS
ncbi:S8 family serine peptidase [Virgibacillus sp. JSM 102003]|uniref:S8 family serine peptidase n=1 Tax=Virgibacillus sp. JSM 102003 TaxID=1562108 RepID=UPI0035C06DEA